MNALGKWQDQSRQGRAVMGEALEAVVLLLAPVVPHIAHTLWFGLGHERAAIDEPWPSADHDAMLSDTMELVVQVNGKLRGHISVSTDAAPSDIESEAFNNANVRRFVEGRDVKRTVVVPGKLVNIVV